MSTAKSSTVKVDESRNIRISVTINKDVVNGVLVLAIAAGFILTIACGNYLVKMASLAVCLAASLAALEYNWKLISNHKD